jgi:hypothetical protein
MLGDQQGKELLNRGEKREVKGEKGNRIVCRGKRS